MSALALLPAAWAMVSLPPSLTCRKALLQQLRQRQIIADVGQAGVQRPQAPHHQGGDGTAQQRHGAV